MFGETDVANRSYRIYGAGVVFEAKRDASYTAQKALEELDIARANRNAEAGVFVMARSHAPEGFPTFARFGNNVLLLMAETSSSRFFSLATRLRRGP